MFFISRSYVLTLRHGAPSGLRPARGKRGTEDHGKRAGASSPSRITSSKSRPPPARTHRGRSLQYLHPAASPLRRGGAPARPHYCHCTGDGIRPRSGSAPAASAARRRPRAASRLQQFVHLEVEASVEEERGSARGPPRAPRRRVEQALREESHALAPPARASSAVLGPLRRRARAPRARPRRVRRQRRRGPASRVVPDFAGGRRAAFTGDARRGCPR